MTFKAIDTVDEILHRVRAFKHFRDLSPDKGYTSPEAQDAITLAGEVERLRRDNADLMAAGYAGILRRELAECQGENGALRVENERLRRELAEQRLQILNYQLDGRDGKLAEKCEELQRELAEATVQLDARRNIHRYVAFALAGDEEADVQLAVDRRIEELAEAQKDAARYRHIRGNISARLALMGRFGDASAEKLDAAIDERLEVPK